MQFKADGQYAAKLRIVATGVAISILAAHVLWTGLIVFLLQHYYDHRLINIRKLKSFEETGTDFSTAFFHTAVTESANGKHAVVFLGSSFTYGYPWQEGVVFSRVAARSLPGMKFANLSIIGAGIRDLTEHARCARATERKAFLLIAEIPLVNSVGNLTSPDRGFRTKCRPHSSMPWSLHRSVLSQPSGTGWIPVLWDEEAYAKPDSDISITKLPSTYFASANMFQAVRSQYVRDLHNYLQAISELGETVWVFVSPIYMPGIEESGGDHVPVAQQIALTFEVCKAYGKVICLDTSGFGTQRELFYNLTHLNQRGHRALGNWFEQQILQQGKGRPLETPPSFPQ